MRSVPFPSGDASPSTTLRRSATRVIRASRSQLMPVRCLPSTFAPATKSASTAAARSTITGMAAGSPAGPIEPGVQPIAATIAPSGANVAAPGSSASLLAFTSLSSWSPRSTSATRLPSSRPCTMSVFTVCVAGTPRNFDTSSIVFCPGVSTVASAAPGAGRGVAGATASASSTFAAYSEPVENAIASSPDSASTWNSCETLPPIAPESACTARNDSPRRVKMRA